MVTSTFAHWPVLVFTISGEVTTDDIDAIRAMTSEAFARRESHVNVFDCRRVSARPDAVIRQQMAKFTEETRDRSLALTLGTAIILESALLRGALTAIHWVAPPAVPVEAVGTFGEGVDRARGWLQSAGRSLSVAEVAALRDFGAKAVVGF